MNNMNSNEKLAIGICIGLALGIVFDSLAIGLCLGTAFGVIWSSSENKDKK